MSAVDPTHPFELNEDLWFEDGDIFVCARRFDSGVFCLYKLHRDILASNSRTLLDLLDKSLARHYIYVGNTPYAFLADNALDIEPFFVAMFYPKFCFFQMTNARSFTHALPVIQIALKYKANDVIDALASELEQDWPMTISEWDASQSEIGLCFRRSGDLGPENRLINRAAAVEAASAVRVAHVANLPNVLSRAYYQLYRIGCSDVWWRDVEPQLGLTLENGEHGSDGSKGKTEGRTTLLTKEDMCHVASGKERLSMYMLSFKGRLSKELESLHPRCAESWDASTVVQSDRDVLSDLSEVCAVIESCPRADVCSDCQSRINERGREEREKVWELLPMLFCVRGV